MSEQPVLATEDLSVGYDGHAVLADINVAIARGSLTVLIGANGSGKSTLLRTLSGVQKPISGSIYIDNLDISDLSRGARARKLSMVFTDRTGGGGLTVAETVGIGRHPYTGMLGHLSNGDKEIIEAAIADVGMSTFIHRRLGSLSDGERQKVMIARALAQTTPLILLDEPTAFLDVAGRIEITALLRRLADNGHTIVLSTHDLGSAIEAADNMWIVDKTARTTLFAPKYEAMEQNFLSKAFPTLNPQLLTLNL